MADAPDDILGGQGQVVPSLPVGVQVPVAGDEPKDPLMAMTGEQRACVGDIGTVVGVIGQVVSMIGKTAAIKAAAAGVPPEQIAAIMATGGAEQGQDG